MTIDHEYPPAQRARAFLNYLFLLAMMAVIAAILTAAMALQYGYGELPCPLCLLQRAAMLGICFGILQSFLYGFSYRYTGLSLLFALFLMIVSARQSLLDIYPRPGHEYIGSAIFGIHMPVWSIIIALATVSAFAIKMSVLGNDAAGLTLVNARSFPILFRAARALGIYVIIICTINLVSVVLQCGFGQCHTTSYQWLP